MQLVPERSSVLDIGCGTGELCFDLCRKKHCRVVGADLSLRMLDFARNGARRSEDLAFLHLSATDLVGVEDHSFDMATIVLLVHELPRHERVRVLGEALRVAKAVLIIDAAAPLPLNAEGLLVRAVEYSFGHSHYRHFKDFLARGGITGLLADCSCAGAVVQSEVFSRKCRRAVVVTGAGSR